MHPIRLTFISYIYESIHIVYNSVLCVEWAKIEYIYMGGKMHLYTCFFALELQKELKTRTF